MQSMGMLLACISGEGNEMANGGQGVQLSRGIIVVCVFVLQMRSSWTVSC